ncbi:MAG TPA: N-acetylmuramoyl-L-alanine amidase [Puia sp.]|uniref:N-acetylmuramoyl-L-alanine amidase family protein n=1 Tax=Puia sp. TaxID=2045100 RepID=UPI002BC96EEF|nr:N-acetylmuramoyl-L-alanine amidase [Puia sp.]HVU97787.1 N-acetylmuramoyl-L-alanine amidase [Puia sp.]
MFKKTATLLTLCGIMVGFTSFVRIPPPQMPLLRTVVIDPGHGGFDPGTHGLITKEKDIALAISLQLGKMLQQAHPGLKIVYTRTTDIMPGNKPNVLEGIRYRAELANRSGGDLFICIHCNATRQPAGSYPVKRLVRYRITGKGAHKRSIPVYSTTWVRNTVHGTACYIWKADRNVNKSDAISRREELLDGENMGDSTGTAFDLTTPEARMRSLLYEKKYFGNSTLFGTLVEREFVRTGRRSEGLVQRQEGIGVLQATGMPSVLIETGYLTNKEEERYLAGRKGQAEVARNIAAAFKHYKDQVEGREKRADN